MCVLLWLGHFHKRIYLWIKRYSSVITQPWRLAAILHIMVKWKLYLEQIHRLRPEHTELCYLSSLTTNTTKRKRCTATEETNKQPYKSHVCLTAVVCMCVHTNDLWKHTHSVLSIILLKCKSVSHDRLSCWHGKWKTLSLCLTHIHKHTQWMNESRSCKETSMCRIKLCSSTVCTHLSFDVCKLWEHEWPVEGQFCYIVIIQARGQHL